MVAWGTAVVVAACGGSAGGGATSPSRPSSYPDAGRVTEAHKRWCTTLGKLFESKWTQQQECEAAHPTGSAEFIQLMSRCYAKQVKELGEHRPDTYAVMSQCTEMVLFGTDPGDVSRTALFKARCARMERCEKLTFEQCSSGFGQLQGSQRSLLTAMYNLQAQYDIAECLSDEDCTTNEDGAHSACYKRWFDRRVWLPGNRKLFQ
jgi:hypothetical protein